MATILMKLSEGRGAHQYNRWIQLLTLRQDTAMKNYILQNLLPRRGSMLDVGCGTGSLLIEAGRRGVRGVGIDMNSSMLFIARNMTDKRNLGRRIKFQVGNATDLALPEDEFDLAISTLMISELQPDEVQQFIMNVTRTVKPGGVVAIGGEGIPRGVFATRFIGLLRRVSYWIVSRLTTLGPHPYHKVAAAMKAAGLTPKYKVLFMSGLLVLYVAEVV